MSEQANFKVETDGYVRIVTMDRPPVNAINRAMRDEGTALFSALGEDESCRAIVLTGNGRTFCAGADLEDRPDLSELGAYTRHNRLVRELFQSLSECPKPIVAAINGPAIGAGLVLASCCDVLIAQDSTWVSMPEVEVGLAGGVRHMLRHFGQSDARLLMLTARRIPTPELLRMGVLSAITPAGRLLADGVGIAQEIASKSPASVRAVKASFVLGEELSLHSGYRYEQRQSAMLAAGDEHAEARAAFRERRPPVFD